MVRDIRGPEWSFIRCQKFRLSGEILRVVLDSPETDRDYMCCLCVDMLLLCLNNMLLCVNFINICMRDILTCIVWKWHIAFHMYWGNLEQ